MGSLIDKTDSSIISNEELKAEELVKHGQIDEAINIYQQIKPESAHILKTIGVLYSEKKNDFHSAIKYCMKAFAIQEQNGEDVCDTLTELGIAYQNLNEYDLALHYYTRALHIRKSMKNIANNLIGIANTHRSKHNLSKALNYAQQALNLNLSIKSGNELQLALSLVTLANIYHEFGENNQALELYKHALTLVEYHILSNSPVLASFLRNLGVIQLSLKQYTDAKLTFMKVLYIYDQTLCKDHPKRVELEDYVQRIIVMEQFNEEHSYFDLYELLSKCLLL